MILKRIVPRLELQNYIDTFWVYENDFGIPVNDLRVIAPNGKAKFIYPYINSLSAIDNNVQTDYKEQDIFFIGIWDKPFILGSQSKRTGIIGIELSPNGVHSFIKQSAFEITNRIISFSDIYGKTGENLIEKLANTESINGKIDILQSFLMETIRLTNRYNSIIDYSVSLIKSTSGIIPINELENKTGYSRRYIDLLFKDNLDISPKTLSSILRFQSFYKLWANSANDQFYKDNLLELYYDQGHFIKEFKRFTGHSPKQYANQKNEFGKRFYQP